MVMEARYEKMNSVTSESPTISISIISFELAISMFYIFTSEHIRVVT